MAKYLFIFILFFSATVFCQEINTEEVKSIIDEGNLLNNSQKYKEAISKYFKAIHLLEKLNDSTRLATVYTNIGVVNARLKSFENAILYLEKANEYQTKDKNLKLRTLYNISSLYYDKKDFESFLKKAKKVEQLAKELKSDKILSALYCTYCNYYRDLKKYKASINYGLKSYELKKKSSLTTDIIINNIGYSYLLDKNYTKAIEFLSKITNTPNKQLRVYVFNNLKNAYEKLQQKDKALFYANKYIFINDSITKAQEKIKVASLIKKYESSKQEQQIINLKTENQLKESKLKNQQNWFLGLGVFIILLGFLTFFWFKNKKTQQNLEKASIQHKLLRSQLNPHFLFHSLNSIQSYIYQNKKEASANYLANYSKLIRAVFDSSDRDFISVKEDKIAIENYLALQKLNFNEKVKLSLSFNENVSNYKIPPMFVQPFVENAFLHGINSVENGKISVIYQEENNIIKVCIIDNGNGFEKLKNNNTLNKVSSSDVIKKRIENLRKTHNFNILINTKSSKNGTIVTLLFPKKILV